jgi:hypothetical protein
MEQTWGDDPIHPTREVISKMADTLISMVDDVDASSGGGGGATEGRDGREGQASGRSPTTTGSATDGQGQGEEGDSTHITSILITVEAVITLRLP